MAEGSIAPACFASDLIAAADLGSNSFHMIIARTADSHLQIIERMREPVRLAAGLEERGRLSKAAQKRALECLERFGQRLRAMPQGSVRVVGTNTLRRARSAEEFLAAAERALGHPIEVISGQEEARLIYLGVSHSLAPSTKRRLVVDIGGGSTELIIGESFEPLHMESLYMGCVSMSEQYFPKGAITRASLGRAELAARVELEAVENRFREFGWRSAIGASGTILAVAEVVRAARWSEGDITRAALQKLRKALLAAGHVKKLALPGLSPERAPVFPGGVAILVAVFDALGLRHMGTSDGALREGLLYDLVGRIRHEDVRERTVRALSSRYQVDTRQADRVERTALTCLAQTANEWRLTSEEDADMLRWAARLHEIGLAIAHSQYHKHGAYIVANSDLAGFSWREQRLLAALIRGHRRKFPLDEFQELPPSLVTKAERLCILLRLAVQLHHSRSDITLPEFKLTASDKGLKLKFPKGWLAEHPLTRTDLEQEAQYLAAVKFELQFS